MSSPRLRASVIIALLLGSAATALPAQKPSSPDDLLLGTWELDAGASRYSPGPAVRSETRTYARDQKGVRGRIDRVYGDGRKETIEYRADVGQPVPVVGTRAFDAIRLKRVDSRTTEGILSHAGRVFGFSRRTISADGQTMTIMFRREEPGDMVNNVVVFRKQGQP